MKHQWTKIAWAVKERSIHVSKGSKFYVEYGTHDGCLDWAWTSVNEVTRQKSYIARGLPYNLKYHVFKWMNQNPGEFYEWQNATNKLEFQGIKL
jgi:hypothetical protein